MVTCLESTVVQLRHGCELMVVIMPTYTQTGSLKLILKLLRHASVLIYHLQGVYSCLFLNFRVCKSVHHRTIQINHQPDATVFQFIILTFIYSSACFGRVPAHYQELNDCSGSLWFYLRIVVIVVLWPAGRPDHERNTHTHTHIIKQYKTTTVQIKTNTVQDIPKWNGHNIIKCTQRKNHPIILIIYNFS
jgi:hypothetical protein